MKESVTLASMRFRLPAILTLLIYVLSPVRATPQQEPSAEGPALNKALVRRTLPGTHDLQLIVRFTKPSVVEWVRAEEGRAPVQRPSSIGNRSHMDLQASRARSYQGELAADHRQFIENMGGLNGVEIQGSLDTVMNAVIARVPMEHYSRVRRMPGVRKIYFSRPQRLALDASAVLVDAQGLWDRAGGRSQAGRGVKIGIIDSGIDVTHPMFMDNTLTAPAGYPKGETALTNSKVIVARNYINLLAQPQPVLNASDEVGHGTFAAGEAAGKQVTAPLATMSGMAPGAFLGNYKVFGTPGINDLTTSAAVVAAIDAAVADGMDVMSLSLGALDYAVPSDDPEVAAIENAVAAGVVVAVAAGNDGPGTHTISSPGSAPSAITVGSVSNSRAFATQLRVTVPAPVPSNLSNISYLPGDGPSIITKIPATGAVDAQTLDDNGLACSSLPSGSLGGKIALIERGSCTFASKVNNAAAAGAAAGVRQLFPQLNALDIKSVITSTASPNLTVDGESPPTVIQAGSGLLDMGSASAAQAVFTPTNLNFGTQRYSGNLSRTRALSIKNISSTTDQYTMSIAPIVSGPTLTFDQDTTGPVFPGERPASTFRYKSLLRSRVDFRALF